MNQDHHNINAGGGQPPGNSEVRKNQLLCFFCLNIWSANYLTVISVPESESTESTAASESACYHVSHRLASQFGSCERCIVQRSKVLGVYEFIPGTDSSSLRLWTSYWNQNWKWKSGAGKEQESFIILQNNQTKVWSGNESLALW